MALPFRPDPALPVSRRGVITASALLLGGSLAGCTGVASARVVAADEAPPSTTLPTDDLPALSVALSRALFTASDLVLLGGEEHLEALAPLLGELRAPLLVGTGDVVREELERLGVTTAVVPAGLDVSALGEDIEAVEVDPTSPQDADLPSVTADGEPPRVALLVDPEAPAPARALATAVVEGLGGSVAELPGAEPRASSESVAVAKQAAGEDPSHGVLALGERFGDPQTLVGTLTQAVTVPELPGGGQLVLPYRRMVAAYGSPGTPSLGILGEQDLPASIERVTQLASEYEPFSEVPVIPAFEVITTVASAAAGADGDYSTEVDPGLIQEWIDGAGEAGVYVVLDLQPGRTDFLTQAKRYEAQLRHPHVGLALDPEWRLKPDQKHLRQIGGVDAAEVNAVMEWLAALTREAKLPQKVMILHQFAYGMLRDRAQIRAADHPELAVLLHADGHGTPDLKMSTWRALQQDLPDGIHMAWKNFYDEDTPTFTPEETFAITPRPWFVSYQ